MTAHAILTFLLLRLRAVTPGRELIIDHRQCQRLADAIDAMMRGR